MCMCMCAGVRCTKYITNVKLLCSSNIFTLKLSIYKHSYIHSTPIVWKCWTFDFGVVVRHRRETATATTTTEHKKNRPYPFPEHHVTFAKGLICYLFPICTVVPTVSTFYWVLHTLFPLPISRWGWRWEIESKVITVFFEIQHHNAILLNYKYM